MSVEALVNRLTKKNKHLRKWAKKQHISCYRLYAKELTEFPAIIDWIDGHVVIWLYDNCDSWDIMGAVEQSLHVSPSSIIVKHRGKQRGLQTQYEKASNDQITKIVEEGGLSFELNLSDYLDLGLFLDHRASRALIRDRSSGKRILNLFAYTGSFTCYAIDGFAQSTTTVDISPTYTDWIKRNLEHNGWTCNDQHKVLTMDCIQFLDESNETFDLIICDPPTFSNSKRKHQKTLSINDDYPLIISKCLDRLSSNGTIFFSTNSRKFTLDPSHFPSTLSIKDISHQTMPEDFKKSGIHKSFLIQLPEETPS